MTNGCKLTNPACDTKYVKCSDPFYSNCITGGGIGMGIVGGAYVFLMLIIVCVYSILTEKRPRTDEEMEPKYCNELETVSKHNSVDNNVSLSTNPSINVKLEKTINTKTYTDSMGNTSCS
jgi:hypothetical protein